MSKQVRNTKKSRLVSEFAASITGLYREEYTEMSKSQIVSGVIDLNVGAAASTAIRTILEDELANELERYFHEAVSEAAESIGRPWHMVTVEFFKQSKMAKSKYTMQQQVCVFGNGSGKGKAAGVRFVPEGNINDPMLLLTLEKKMDNSAYVAKAVEARVKNYIESGAVSPDKAVVMNDRLGQKRIK